jgi:hypothetical protein
MTPELKALALADSPEGWDAIGFAVRDTSCEVGGVRLQLGADGRGITGWSLTGILSETRDIDGLPTMPASGEPPAGPAEHPNGAIGIDHVVVSTRDFERTASALDAAGVPLRRVIAGRQGARMGFRRLGPAILELVETSGGSGPGRARSEAPGPAGFWGLVVVVQDLDALAERLGNRLGSIREAVQPGRRIATLGESAGLGEAVAFMSPETPS